MALASIASLEPLESRRLLSSSLLYDINPLAGVSYPGNLTLFKGEMYFTAGNTEFGAELWKTDGTEAGTVLVKDILPGSSSSSPSSLTAVGDTLFFTAYGSAHDRQVWKTDGTAGGTMLVKQFGTTNNPVWGMTNVNGTLFFGASDGVHEYGLWKSDGTEAGTVMVKDILPGETSRGFWSASAVAFNGVFYFRPNNFAHGDELWRSDGTAAGTVMVKNINPATSNTSVLVDRFTVAGNLLYFVGDDGAHGGELWRSDGTEAGTYMVKDIAPGIAASTIRSMLLVGDTLFFNATTAAYGSELWKSDGTEAGTVLVKDIMPGTGNSLPLGLANFGGKLFFGAEDGTDGRELWSSDGTEAGTVRVKDIYPGPEDSYPEALFALGDTLYFSASNGADGRQLWKSDGTEAGTAEITNRVFERTDVYPVYMAGYNGTLLFAAGELYRSDGTDAGTVMIKDIQPGTGPSMPSQGVVAGDRVYFTAVDWFLGDEVWQTDGTTAGTTLVASEMNGFAGSAPSGLTPVGSEIFFTLALNTGNRQLWKADAGGATLVKEWSSGSSPDHFFAMGNTLFFRMYDGTSGQELWKSDGTPDGTVMVKDIASSSYTSSDPNDFVEVNGILYFSANDHVHGQELWRSDGTEAGTWMVKDIRPGSSSSGASYLVNVNGVLYFSASDDSHGAVIWKSDGTEAGTVMVSDINGNSSFPLSFLTNLNGILIFKGMDSATGFEFYRSDGTQTGTYVLRDIRPGKLTSSPSLGGVADDRFFFTANDGVHGVEPWVTDGTREGTRLLLDINPGPGGSSPNSFYSAGGFMYFSANDGVHGTELWRSDGTMAGTSMVEDLWPGLASSSPLVLGAVGRKMIVSAIAPMYDWEPRVLMLDERLANAGGAYHVLTGTATLALHGSSTAAPTPTFEWDLDGDGVFGETGASAERGDEVGAAPVMSLAGLVPGTYDIKLRVTDSGGQSQIDTGTVTITAVAPVVDISTPTPSGYMGRPFTINLSSAEAVTSWIVEWGDGTSQTLAGSASSAKHVYTAAGDYSVSAVANTATGAWPTMHTAVANVAPAAVISGVVYYDADDDGVRDAAEGGLSGLTVYADLNNSGVFDTGDESGITDSTGVYVIGNLPAGAIMVRAMTAGGRVGTSPGGGSGVFNAVSGQVLANVDFGQVTPKTGLLDWSFGDGGRQITSFTGSSDDYGTAMALQSNGATVVAGMSLDRMSNLVVVRYYADGILDTAFGNGGKQVIDLGGYDICRSVAIDSMGRIVIAATSSPVYDPAQTATDFAIVRLTANGLLDTTFDGDGIRILDFNGSIDQPTGVATQADNRIVVVGASKPAGGTEYGALLMRFNTDGSLDSTFGSGGVVTVDVTAGTDAANAVTIDSSGWIVIAGGAQRGSYYDFLVARYLANGAADTSFGGRNGDPAGVVITAVSGLDDAANAVSMYVNGRIVVAGYAIAQNPSDQTALTRDAAIVRYNSDGTLDTSFAGGVKTIDFKLNSISRDDYVSGIGIEPNSNRIVIAGTSRAHPPDYTSGDHMMLARLNVDGSNDSVFGEPLVDPASAQCAGVAVRSNGRIVMAGVGSPGTGSLNDFLVTQYNNSALDGLFGSGGRVWTDFQGTAFGGGRAVASQSDGRIVVGGWASIGAGHWEDFALVRYLANGKLDPSFGYDRNTGGYGRVNTDFQGLSDRINAVAVQADGKIVAAGYATVMTGTVKHTDIAVARYKVDGTLDTSFGTGGKATFAYSSTYGEEARAITILADGRILIAGQINRGSGQPDFAVIRLSPAGVLDTTFGVGGWAKIAPSTYNYSAELKGMAVALDGRIVLGGYARGARYDQFAIVRFTSAGAVDTTLGGSGRVNTSFGSATTDANAIGVMSDGRIVVAGSYGDSNQDFAIARYNVDGTLDSTFGNGGKVTYDVAGAKDEIDAVRVRSDGRIEVAGGSTTPGVSGYSLTVARFLADGALDTSFGLDGKFVARPAAERFAVAAMTLGSRGQIVVAGSAVPINGYGSFMAARFFGDELPDAPPRVTDAWMDYTNGTIRLSFNKSVANSLSVDDLTLTDLSSGEVFPSSNMTVMYRPTDNVASIFTYLPFTGGQLASGIYRLSIAGAGVTDSEGRPMQADYRVSFAWVTEPTVLSLPPGQAGLMSIDFIDIVPGGTLDIANHDVVLRHSDSDNGVGRVEGLRKWLRSALVGGGEENPWTGTGLTSSAARDDVDMDRGIAVFNNDDGEGNPWMDSYKGVLVDQNSIILKYTYYGDSNIDGQITGDDFAAATTGWFDQMNGIVPTWMTGDYDYDGKVTGDDFALVTASWFSQDRAHPLAAAEAEAVGMRTPLALRAAAGGSCRPAEADPTPTSTPPSTPIDGGSVMAEASVGFAKREPNVLLVDDLAVLA